MTGEVSEDFFEAARLLRSHHRMAARYSDEVPDVPGGLLRQLSEHAHFVRDHRKAGALFAGPGGFDRSIQRQQVRTEADVLDIGDHLVDLGGGGLDATGRPVGAIRREVRGVENVARLAAQLPGDLYLVAAP